MLVTSVVNKYLLHGYKVGYSVYFRAKIIHVSDIATIVVHIPLMIIINIIIKYFLGLTFNWDIGNGEFTRNKKLFWKFFVFDLDVLVKLCFYHS